jgi:hypothetical protein
MRVRGCRGPFLSRVWTRSLPLPVVIFEMIPEPFLTVYDDPKKKSLKRFPFLVLPPNHRAKATVLIGSVKSQTLSRLLRVAGLFQKPD